MSAKLLHSLADDIPDLHTQFGCMNGILHLFNRRRFLPRKRLLPGQSGDHGKDSSNVAHKLTAKNLVGLEKDKDRSSVDSSRTSVSSSCSSAFSSAQSELSSSGRKISPEPSSQMLPIKLPNSSLNSVQKPLDLQDVVKDSMYRESRKVSVKTTTKVQGAKHNMEHVDSPRLLQQQPKSVKPKISNTDGSSRFQPRDSPRLSYDERESRGAWKNSMKPKEIPRLSLDSKERSMKKSSSISRSDILLDNLKQANGKISGQNLHTPQEPGSNKRLSGVVAKLMGLEAVPEQEPNENHQARTNGSSTHDNLGKMSNLTRKGAESKQEKVCGSPRTPKRDSASPRLSSAISQLKKNSKSSLGPKALRPEIPQEAHIQVQKLSPSVYGAIEKRLNEIEFKRSSKDLRALKQILEAMQKSTERFDQKKEDHATNMEPQISYQGPELCNFDQITSQMTSETTKVAEVSRKPRNAVPFAVPLEGIPSLHKLRTRDSTDHCKDPIEKQIAKDRTLRKNHPREPSYQPKHHMDKSANALRSTKTSKTLNHVGGVSPWSPRMSPIIVIPRLQQKNVDSKTRTQPSDTSSYGMLTARKHMESGFPCRDFKPKSLHRHEGDDKLNRCNTETRSWGQQGDSILAQSNETTLRFREDSFKAEPTTPSLEQPSPVSVLDATFYSEESPSPVKKTSYNFKDEENAANSVEEELASVDLFHLPSLSQQFGLVKPEDIKNLSQSLRRVNSAHVLVPQCGTTPLLVDNNPVHQYIAEILLESGLLLNQDSGSTIIQLQQSVHLINPKLFLFLEKKNRPELNQKIQRKLIFDTVSELIVRKSASARFLEPRVSPTNLRVRNSDGQKLLKELCSEIDCLLAKEDANDDDDDLVGMLRDDMVHPEEDWVEYRTAVPGLVLDIERLIFKDLINEVVTGEVTSLKARATKHRRQLFS